jgi:predicted membrane chloride channel (bestrophin family)
MFFYGQSLLLVICVSVLFVICATIEEPWLIYCFNSVTIFGFIGLNEAARELENPFGCDSTDLYYHI